MSAAETLDLDHGSEANLARRVRQLAEELAVERAEREEAIQALADANRIQAVLERDKSVADGEAAVARAELEQERLERSLLSARMAALTSERDLALASMGWWSQRRYRHRLQAKTAHPSAGDQH